MCRVWMAMLAVVTFSFKPLIGGLIYQSQIHVKHEITRQEEKDKYQEAQHEDDPWKCQKEMLKQGMQWQKDLLWTTAQLLVKTISVVFINYLDDKDWSSMLLLTLLINVVSMQESSSKNSFEQHVCCKDCNIACHGTHTQEIQQEESGVLGTNAVIHPHTMMVESLHTSTANPCRNEIKAI